MEYHPYFQRQWQCYPAYNHHAFPAGDCHAIPARDRHAPTPVRWIPVQHPKPQPQPQPYQTTPYNKAVSIPVRFVNSGKNRAESAVKIQIAFRGFLVRKYVKKLVEIRREVDETERRILNEVELIKRDEKERLRVNETLMSLLFRLDSVKGVDYAVRECRKAVIRRVIGLQERVDAIVVNDGNGESVEDPDGTVDDFDGKGCGFDGNVENGEDPDGKDDDFEGRCCGFDGKVENGEDPDGKADDFEGECRGSDDNVENVKEKGSGSGLCLDGQVSDEERKLVSEMLERMARENERMMMGLMEEIYRRNEMQTRMLESLSQRVEQLERAFMCDTLRRKKNKKNGAHTTCAKKD